jgi:hypothetical protein
VRPDVGFAEAIETDSEIEDSCWRDGVDVVIRASVVDAEEEVAGRDDTVYLARPCPARFPPIIVRVAEEEILLIGLACDRSDRFQSETCRSARWVR